jgi:localization factor PodJL
MSLDQAIAEITARQKALDVDPAMPPAPPRVQTQTHAPAHTPRAAAAPCPPAPQQTFTPPPPYVPEPPTAQALPPQDYAPTGQISAPASTPPPAPAPDFSSLESQLRTITSQIEKLNRNDAFASAIMDLRKELADIGRSLKEAMPRRALDALEGEVRRLGDKIEKNRAAGVDPATLANMERGLSEVRDALNTLTPAENLVGFEEAVRNLSGKVEQIVHQDPAAFQQLEAAVTALRSLVTHVASNDALSNLSQDVRGLAAKIEEAASQKTLLAPAALASLEASLEKRIAGLPVLGMLERGFNELKSRLDNVQQANNVGDLRRDLDRTQDTLQALHGTLGMVVDRLTVIEANLQKPQAPQPAPARPLLPEAQAQAPSPVTPQPVAPQHPAPMPAPAATIVTATAATAPAAPPAPVIPPQPTPAPAVQTAHAPKAAPKAAPVSAAPLPARERPPVVAREPINPNLPPDFPLEPGSGTPHPRSQLSPAERIAASEAALAPGTAGMQMAGAHDTAPTNFIAAARRAAQAAAPAAPGAADADAAPSRSPKSPGRGLGQRMRALIVGGSAVLVIGATTHLAIKMLDPFGHADIGVVFTDPPANFEEKMLAEEQAEERAAQQAAANAPDKAPLDLIQFGSAQFGAPPPSGLLLPDSKPAAPQFTSSTLPVPDPAVTGSVAGKAAGSAPAQGSAATVSDKFPAMLRQAALSGDASAEYEIGIRHLEGRGVTQDIAEAVRWLERAANAGLAPAQFRLGGLYEKGQGVTKDTELARKLYTQAAEAGNAKAMHNLAVLYAEGIDGKPDYRIAAAWFRKAAGHGIADSQHNLGILYARGVGVEQNLTESYKWFSLASAQGDGDSASKRDDVAARLDQASLAAAKRAVKTFVATPQPEDAVNVRTPAGGWDGPAGNGRKKTKSGAAARISAS